MKEFMRLAGAMIVGAMPIPYAWQIDGFSKWHGMSSSIRLLECPSMIAIRVAAV